jgi:serine/threonine protein kinase
MLKKSILLTANIFENPFPQNEIIAERYKIINHLGAGSYGHSYLVVDQLTEQVQVLKSLRIHKRITKSGRKGFELEKELLRSINHPGFPTYYSDGNHKSIPFYTMEYIEGKNFEQLIFQEGKKYSEDIVFSITLQLLELIDFLHKRKIIHRDIRIPNVIVSESKIHLIDLGLSRRVNQGVERRRRLKTRIRKELNPQADFYGLGHFLLFLLYSNYYFPDKTKEVSWEKELDISHNAKQIIRRLLQIEDPYESCAEIKLDIVRLLEDVGGKENVIL